LTYQFNVVSLVHYTHLPKETTVTALDLAPDPTTTEKSFDDIKQTRPDGSEFWSARALMTLMGYARWENFEVPLLRAMRSAENQNVDLTSLFLESQEKTSGRTRTDYHLSRFAAYLVTMNGDPNKTEVAAAQGYFAKQTRFAELVQSNPALLASKTEAPRALSAREVGTFYADTLAAYRATVTPETVSTETAHALAYSMQEFARLMTHMVKEAALMPSLDSGDTDSIEGAPMLAINGPSGTLAPYVQRSGGAAYEGSRLPDFRFTHPDETNELITWAAFAKSKGLPRCGRCGQGLSRRIMYAATACGTSRGRVNGHNVFSLPAWEVAWELHGERYTERHNDPARNHNGVRA